MLIFSVLFHACIVLALIFHSRFISKPRINDQNRMSFMWAAPVSKSQLKSYKNKLPPPIVVPQSKKPSKPKPKIIEKKTKKEDQKKSSKKEIKESNEEKQRIEKALSELYSELEQRRQPKADNYSPDQAQSQGLAQDGIQGMPEGIERYKYKMSVKTAVENNWFVINKALIKSMDNPKVIVTIKLNERGQIVSRKLERSSGNSYYDNSVLRAIDKSDPLPPPPESLAKEALSEGIEFEFVPPLD